MTLVFKFLPYLTIVGKLLNVGELLRMCGEEKMGLKWINTNGWLIVGVD